MARPQCHACGHLSLIIVLCGACSDAVVVGVSKFGVFVEIAPGVKGLCHISELDINRTPNTDAWENGDAIDVKLIDVRCHALSCTVSRTMLDCGYHTLSSTE